MPAAATSGSAPACGSRPISAAPGPIPATASAYAEGESRSRSAWSLAKATAASMPASSRRGCSAATMAASWQHVSGLREHPSRPEWQPGGAGLILHSLVPHPERRAALGRISAAGVFHTDDGGDDLGAAQPRHARRLHARGPALSRDSASACTVSSWRPACRTGSTSRTIAACTAATTAAGAGQHRGGPAVDLRLPGRRAPARPGHALPRCRSTATSGRFRPTAGGSLAHADGGELAGAARGPAAGERLLRRAAPGAGHRQARAGRRLFRHHAGELFASADEGESWSRIAEHLPAILSVKTLVVDRCKRRTGEVWEHVR